MNWKAAGIALVIVAAVVGGYLVFKKGHSGAPVTATIRVNVAPKEQLDFVAAKANSPFFKYLMSKKSGVKLALSKQLKITPQPSAAFRAEVGLDSRQEARQYAAIFAEVLQEVCGNGVQLTVVESSVK